MNEINVRTQTDRQLVIQWLSAFESALTSGSEAALSAVLWDEVHWRDLMAFTWTITPHDTREETISDLIRSQDQVAARNFRLNEAATPPRRVRRHGSGV